MRPKPSRQVSCGSFPDQHIHQPINVATILFQMRFTGPSLLPSVFLGMYSRWLYRTMLAEICLSPLCNMQAYNGKSIWLSVPWISNSSILQTRSQLARISRLCLDMLAVAAWVKIHTIGHRRQLLEDGWRIAQRKSEEMARLYSMLAREGGSKMESSRQGSLNRQHEFWGPSSERLEY